MKARHWPVLRSQALVRQMLSSPLRRLRAKTALSRRQPLLHAKRGMVLPRQQRPPPG